MLVRNEDWCLGLTLRAALMWCDAVVLMDHASTDATRDIAHEVLADVGNERLLILTNDDPEWREMELRQKMLAWARGWDATHVAMIDADEILTGDIIDTPGGAGALALAPREVLQLPLYNLRGGLNRYHNNGIWGKRVVSVSFRDDPRLHWEGDRFHSREPSGAIPWRLPGVAAQGHSGVMHLWGASERRLRSKHALYKVTERLRWPTKPVAEIDRMYSWAIHGDADNPAYGTPSTWTYAAVPAKWWEPYSSLMLRLHVDAEPWQECEVQRIVAAHGREAFAGLDLFGVA